MPSLSNSGDSVISLGSLTLATVGVFTPVETGKCCQSRKALFSLENELLNTQEHLTCLMITCKTKEWKTDPKTERVRMEGSGSLTRNQDTVSER